MRQFARMKYPYLLSIITSVVCLTAAQATVIPVDVGSPRLVRNDIFLSAAGLDGTPVNGQTLSLDYQFSNLIHLFPGQSGIYVAIRAQTNSVAMPNALYPSVSSSAYAVGLNGFQGPTLYLPGNTMLFGPNVTEILFGLSYPIGQDGVPWGPVNPGLYLTGLHFDLTLPDIEGVEITGLTLHLDSSLSRSWENKFAIMNHVPEIGDSAAILGLGVLALMAYRKFGSLTGS